jgi:GxxExxY protein
LTENDITGEVVDAAIEVHRLLGGPGLLESVYEEALVCELQLRGLRLERQKPVPIVYKSRRLACDLRVDILVEGRVVIECKATTEYNPVFDAQALTYLRLMDLRVALVINFGERLVKDGLHRVVNGL